jgi:glycosyltransferase involved in cell wall biosynthesis
MREEVALLTGCQDRSYAVGLATALAAGGVQVEFVAGDSLDGSDLRSCELIEFVNLRGSQSEDAPTVAKVLRVLRYYIRLLWYAVSARPRVFHILWNNKFEYFDRTLLMLWYRLMGRTIVLTAHNVNAAARDGGDSFLNRLTLRCQYHLVDHIFVHSERLRKELEADFGVSVAHTSVIPFGINNMVRDTEMTKAQARQMLGLDMASYVALFFGQIAPYKGLHVLLRALPEIAADNPSFRLVVAGKVKRGSEGYFADVSRFLEGLEHRDRVVLHATHVPDEDVEVYFKAADVVVLPYEKVFQSGVPFIAFRFGRPVIATTVGSLPDDVVSGRNGLLCEPHSPSALASAIGHFFESRLFLEAPDREADIRELAEARHSWREVGVRTRKVYASVSSSGGNGGATAQGQ